MFLSSSVRKSQVRFGAFLLSCCFRWLGRIIADNGLQLQEVGDFEAQNCLPTLNLIRSTKLQLTTEPPISCRCCYGLVFFPFANLKFVKMNSLVLVIDYFSCNICIIIEPQYMLEARLS